MSQKVILMGVLQGSIPVVTITGSLTEPGGVTVEVTTAGVSGAAKITVTADDGAVVLAETLVTSATPIAMAAGYGSITLTWTTGDLRSGDVWIYSVTGGAATPPEAYERNRTGVIAKARVDGDGFLVVTGSMTPSATPTPVESADKPDIVQQLITVLKAGVSQPITFADPCVGFSVFNASNLTGDLQVSLDDSVWFPMTAYGHTADIYKPPAGYSINTKLTVVYLKNINATTDITAILTSWEVS